jgi:hypothetical protein
MENIYSPPLSISFIWHPSDLNAVEPILDAVRASFARDRARPFSRGLNIPLFFFSSHNTDEPPSDNPSMHGKRNIIFVFTSVNTNGHEEWREYVENLPRSPAFSFVPIAMDREGLAHNGSLVGKNCIRAYDWPADNKDLYATVSLAHEIYRYNCPPITQDDASKASSITIFLSHAKAEDTGRLHSEEIKKLIDNTNMNRFFDSTEISPGFQFDQEIEKSVKKSTLVAIESDAYSSRYWCQREILCAKQHDRPIIVVNSLNDYADRIFPAASNVPCVHVSSDTPISQRDILRILSASILETVRHSHAMQCLEFYKDRGWISSDCVLSARPPEIRQALKAKVNNQERICYPEPPIYSYEADWHSHLGIEAFTPLWNIAEQNFLTQNRIGISISDVQDDGFSRNHIHSDSLIRLAQDLGRHLLARSATLIYGGDLRPDGFTEFILDEAAILKERIGGNLPKIENHLAWPLYKSKPEIIAWRAKYSQVMKTKEHIIPEDIANGIDPDVFISPNTPENSYIWSRCLTEMREQSIACSTARICAGGKLSGYKGKMPGVLEEILIGLKEARPIYLLGAFGGVTSDVCSLILEGKVPDSFTARWQVAHNEGYSDLQNYARTRDHDCDYEETVGMIQTYNLSELALRSGLDEKEYKRLMISPFIDECIHIIMKGLKAI